MKTPRKSPPPGSARLFSDPRHPAPPATGVHVANIDGASRGNPGPAAYAVLLRAPDGKVVLQLGKYLGRETNNVAEYHALLSALDYTEAHGIRALRVRSDSELVVNQMRGLYKVKHPALRPLHERALKLSRALDYFVIESIPREENREADRLANQALDNAAGKNEPRPVRPAPFGFVQGRQGKNSKLETRAQNSQPPRAHPDWIGARAHYVKGVLVPLEPLDLPEGAEVEMTLRKISNQ